jgi:hypothetical protein
MTTATNTATNTKEAWLKMTRLSAGPLSRGAIEDTFAQLRAAGCTIEHAEVVRGLLFTTYYNTRVTGPEKLIRSLLEWLKEIS